MPILYGRMTVGFALLAACVWMAVRGGAVAAVMLAGMLGLYALVCVGAWRTDVSAAEARARLAAARTVKLEWERLLHLTGDLFCVVGLDGRVRALNAAWEAVLGFSAAEVAARSWTDFAQPWAPSATFADLMSGAAEGETHRFECLAPSKTGPPRWLAWTVQFFPSERACYAVAQDVDEKRKAAAAFADRCDELARSNAELEQFAYVASHDLQEPLRMVSNYTQLLAERYHGQIDERAQRFIHYAVDGASRMHSLIQDLLALARVNFRGKDFRAVPADGVLREALKNLESAITEAGATVTTSSLPVVYGNQAYLVQLMQNLVTNAIKFRAERPLHIHIWARQDHSSWTIGIRDNGIGIAPEHCARIFGIFERLHSRSRYPGTGIGLALCRKIVELHRGKIWVESQPDLGSTFYFTLAQAGETPIC